MMLVGLAVLIWANCVEISGGAAELNWTLRDFEGRNIGTGDDQCTLPGVAAVRLLWTNQDTLTSGFTEFPCASLGGATPFEIEPGPVTFSVAPVCGDGQAAAFGTYRAPPTILRNVDNGRVTFLRTVLLEVQYGAVMTCP